MAALSNEDALFLKGHRIPLTSAFDASGMPTREWKMAMREQGKFVAYGVSCIRGHSLKTRSGNCIRCNPAAIAFARRVEKAGYVYLARSVSLRMVKVGFSANDPENRIYIANIDGYAGAKDWHIEECFYLENAGRLELDIHTALEEFRTSTPWIRNGYSQLAKEVYFCSLERARTELLGCLSSSQLKELLLST